MAEKATGSTKKVKAKVTVKKSKTEALVNPKTKAKSVKPKAEKKVVTKKAAAPKKAVAKKIVTPKKAAVKKTATPKIVAAKKPVAKKEAASPSQKLADLVVAGMEEMKALDIVILDLRKIQNSVCDFFIIASGNSSTHVDAIAGSLEKEVKQTTGEYPWKREGFSNSEWILIDYVSVIAHVFQQHTREFYNLEDLWADAAITKIENKD
jgi:ribosome-associated protein